MNNLGQKFGGDWTEQKLDCVSKYLNAYTQIMNHREFDFMYIDAFAGMGHRELKSENDIAIRRFLAGSARRALEVKLPFTRYVFIEEDKNSFAELKKLKDEFPNRNIKCINRDANESLKTYVGKQTGKRTEQLCFLIHTGWKLSGQQLN